MVFSTNIETSGGLTTTLPNVSVSVGNTIVCGLWFAGCGLQFAGCSLRFGNVTLTALPQHRRIAVAASSRHRRAAGAVTPLALLARLFARLFMRISF
jgi:hypothetical protein